MISLKTLFFVFVLSLPQTNCQLYNKNDNLTLFDQESFDITFDDKSDDNWFIQFYSSFCGHCIGFAPKFKKFITEAKYWTEVIHFGVVDCSTYSSLCEKQDIQYYPFFKLFLNKTFSKSSPKGQELNLQFRDLKSFFEVVIYQIELQIKPTQLIEARPGMQIKEAIYLLLIGNNKIQLKRTVLIFTCRLVYPLYYRYDSNKKYFNVKLFKGTSDVSQRAANIKKLFEILSEYLKDDARYEKYVPYEAINNTLIVINNNSSIKVIPVYNQDIYSSIYYAFTNEISDSVLNNINNVIILRNFVNTLFLYSDINRRLTSNFKKLVELLDDKIDSRSNIIMDWADMLRRSKIPKIEPIWIGCNGSLPHFRRYPCGLWTLFHTLTVNHHNEVISGQIENGGSANLIRNIRDFITTFFKCKECAENFKLETKNYKTIVKSSSKAVVYLWEVHNSVNKRLAKAPSDDPYHPKTSFPTLTYCSNCRLQTNNEWPRMNQWNFSRVLKFLVQYYSKRVPFHFEEHL